MNEEKTFKVTYFHGDGTTHYYMETWNKLPLFCPNCGQQGIWRRDDGDYYVGEEHICVPCNHSFYLPDGTTNISGHEQGKQRLENLAFTAE